MKDVDKGVLFFLAGFVTGLFIGYGFFVYIGAFS